MSCVAVRYAPPVMYSSAPRDGSSAGTWYRNDENVSAILTGVAPNALNDAPPSVDLATNNFWSFSLGQKAKTSPWVLVLMSPPSEPPVVSEPLTCSGACQVPPGPARRATKVGPLFHQRA